MTKITQEMRDIAAKTPVFILATAGRDGKPNGVPMGFACITADDEIVLMDNYLNKTRRNIEENPVAAVSFWSREARGGYQFKGKARIDTSGESLEKAMEQFRKRQVPHKPRGAVIIKVEEIYEIGAKRDSSRNLF